MVQYVKSSRASSPNTKIQDVPNVPTIGTPVQNINTVDIPFTPATTGGRAAVYRAVSNPGGIQGISYGSSPVQVSGLDSFTSYTFQVRGETAAGATTGYSSTSSSITPVFSDMELITSQVLTSAVTSVTFSSIPTTYKHLQVRVVSNVQNDLNFRFNGDSGANYAYHYLYANLAGNNVASGSLGNTDRGYMGYVASSSSTVQASFILDIVDAFSTSKFKTTRTLSSTVPDTNTQRFVMLNSSLWRSTAAVNSISMFTNTNSNLGIGSRFSLYGIRG